MPIAVRVMAVSIVNGHRKGVRIAVVEGGQSVALRGAGRLGVHGQPDEEEGSQGEDADNHFRKNLPTLTSGNPERFHGAPHSAPVIFEAWEEPLNSGKSAR